MDRQKRLMHRTITLLFFICLPLFCGCGAEPPSLEELGRIVFSASEVPGADEPYSLPEYLREAPAESDPLKRAPGD